MKQQQQQMETEGDAKKPRPEVELYDPFNHHFVSQNSRDPFHKMFDHKPANDDF